MPTSSFFREIRIQDKVAIDRFLRAVARSEKRTSATPDNQTPPYQIATREQIKSIFKPR